MASLSQTQSSTDGSATSPRSADPPRRRWARASLFATRRQPAGTISVALTPMIDITFNLLIFFLVATSFHGAEGVLRSRLPHARSAPKRAAVPISPVRLRIEQTGPGLDDYELRIDNIAWRSRSFDDLASALERILRLPGYDRQVPVILAPAEKVRWQHVVNAYNAALRAGFENIGFGSPRPRPSRAASPPEPM